MYLSGVIPRSKMSTCSIFQDPYTVICPTADPGQNFHAMTALLRAIMRNESSPALVTDLEGTIKHDIQRAMEKDATFEEELIATFTLQLLLATYKSALWMPHQTASAGVQPTATQGSMEFAPTTNLDVIGRIERFVDKVLKWLRTIYNHWTLACGCKMSFNEAISHTIGLFEKWSPQAPTIFERSPWVAGLTLVLLRRRAEEIGHELCAWSGTVLGGVLHMYNFMAKHGAVQEQPGGELLCELLKIPIFLGKRPVSIDASSNFLTFAGATLTKHVCNSKVCKRGQKCPPRRLVRPKTFRGEDTRRKRVYERFSFRLSHLHKIVDKGYEMDSELWANALGVEASPPSTLDIRVDKELERLASESVDPFTVFHDRLLEEFNAPCSAARFNYFALYDILEGVWTDAGNEQRWRDQLNVFDIENLCRCWDAPQLCMESISKLMMAAGAEAGSEISPSALRRGDWIPWKAAFEERLGLAGLEGLFWTST